MKTVSNRQLRQTVSAQQRVMEEGVAPTMRALASHADVLEARLNYVEAVTTRMTNRATLRARLRWLLTGR